MLADISQFGQIIANAGQTVIVGNRLSSDPFGIRSVASVIPDPPDGYVRELGVVNEPGRDNPYTGQSKESGTILDVSSDPPASNAPVLQPKRSDFAEVMATQQENRLKVVEDDVTTLKENVTQIKQDVGTLKRGMDTILTRLP